MTSHNIDLSLSSFLILPLSNIVVGYQAFIYYILSPYSVRSCSPSCADDSDQSGVVYFVISVDIAMERRTVLYLMRNEGREDCVYYL